MAAADGAVGDITADPEAATVGVKRIGGMPKCC